jgi:diadenosine tetraphosphate (Ap4A) HIT family hydrolase
MLYKDFLEHLDGCPFCGGKNALIVSNAHGYITYSLAPYHKHHLLVIPTRHTESLLDLGKEESEALLELLRTGARLLSALGYQSYSILLREGVGINKSIPHLHYHLVPDDPIGDLNQLLGKDRLVLSDKEIEEIVGELRGAAEKLN